jgi:hypothetical protein
MPQLDIYTYFTQFQWLLIIFTLLFLLINSQFIPTFQSLFEARSALQGTPRTTELESQKGATFASESKDGVAEGGVLKVFEYEKAKHAKTTSKPTTSSQLVVSKWDQIYDKFAKAAPAPRPKARTQGTTAPFHGAGAVGGSKSNERSPNPATLTAVPGSGSGKKGKAQSNKKGTAR